MVGDVKQSIYRFRQAKPELFLDKYNRYSLEDGSKDRKIQLYKNYGLNAWEYSCSFIKNLKFLLHP